MTEKRMSERSETCSFYHHHFMRHLVLHDYLSILIIKVNYLKISQRPNLKSILTQREKYLKDVEFL